MTEIQKNDIVKRKKCINAEFHHILPSVPNYRGYQMHHRRCSILQTKKLQLVCGVVSNLLLPELSSNAEREAGFLNRLLCIGEVAEYEILSLAFHLRLVLHF